MSKTETKTLLLCLTIGSVCGAAAPALAETERGVPATTSLDLELDSFATPRDWSNLPAPMPRQASSAPSGTGRIVLGSALLAAGATVTAICYGGMAPDLYTMCVTKDSYIVAEPTVVPYLGLGSTAAGGWFLSVGMFRRKTFHKSSSPTTSATAMSPATAPTSTVAPMPHTAAEDMPSSTDVVTARPAADDEGLVVPDTLPEFTYRLLDMVYERLGRDRPTDLGSLNRDAAMIWCLTARGVDGATILSVAGQGLEQAGPTAPLAEVLKAGIGDDAEGHWAAIEKLICAQEKE